jgi:hypothetical protein
VTFQVSLTSRHKSKERRQTGKPGKTPCGRIHTTNRKSHAPKIHNNFPNTTFLIARKKSIKSEHFFLLEKKPFKWNPKQQNERRKNPT